LLKYNGCILADSVGLGKTFEALAVIKYFLMRNSNVLVLCPKRLEETWQIYRQMGDARNVLAQDKLNYTPLSHTDLQREFGTSSSGIDFKHFDWGAFDLVVIDESHNFRNRPSRGNVNKSRYYTMLNKVIKSGISSKVLMLSATPVNNRVADLKNQIAFITQERDDAFTTCGIPSVEATALQAQKQFNKWLKFDDSERTTKKLLSILNQDYFQLLDTLTIARSRKHITRYYRDAETSVGHFPERLKPIKRAPDIAPNDLFPNLKIVNETITSISLAAYNLLTYIRPEKKEEYNKLYTQQLGNNKQFFRRIDRDQSASHLIRINLLKRMESSISSFTRSLEAIVKVTNEQLDIIANFEKSNSDESISSREYSEDEVEDEDEDITEINGRKGIRIKLQDIDLLKWRNDLQKDQEKLQELIDKASKIDVSTDCKLEDLKNVITQKINNPINPGNKKVLIFTAFADTAEYLYDSLSPWALEKFGLHSAVVSGSRKNKCNLEGIRTDQTTLLSHFSPISKELPSHDLQLGEIDILIATDCVSEGQNLQDCDYLINYDIHWNPVRIIQRFGRIDRLKSKNSCIQLVNFWPTASLDEYINLENRVKGRMVMVNLTTTGDYNIIENPATAKESSSELVQEDRQEVAFRVKQLQKLQDDIVDIEEIDGGLSITDLTMGTYRADVETFERESPNILQSIPSYFTATIDVSGTDKQPGAYFCLKACIELPTDKKYPLAPYYLVFVDDNGVVKDNYELVKASLDDLKDLVWDHTSVSEEDDAILRRATKDFSDMSHYTSLLSAAVNAITGRVQESQGASCFTPGGTTIGQGKKAKGVNDFEVIAMLTVTKEQDA
jgi:hypothetical protein